MATHAHAILFISLTVVFLGMLGFQWWGHRVGVRRVAREPSAACEGMSAIEGSLFALLGLLVAFTLSGAESRLQERRRLVADEANAIGTAYLRVDLLPEATQQPMRDKFRRYVDARIAFYELLFNQPAAGAMRQRSLELQREIWGAAVIAARPTDTAGRTLLFSSLNEMIDITTVRDQALRTHVPLALLVLLVLLAFTCAFFAGNGMAKNRRPGGFHAILFAGIMAVTAFVILNLEFPRAGFVRLGLFDVFLKEVRESMGP